MVSRVRFARFSPIQGGAVKHQERNVVHIIKEEAEEIVTLCGSRFHFSRMMERDHDHQSRLCTRCMRVKDKQDRGA